MTTTSPKPGSGMAFRPRTFFFAACLMAFASLMPHRTALADPAANSAPSSEREANPSAGAVAADAVAPSPVAPASTDAGTTPTATAAPSALDYLKLLEEKNKDVRTMVGQFVQTRISTQFYEEATYTGQFHYAKPNRFRVDYTGKDGKRDESTLLMLTDELWEYVPSIEQATRMRLTGQKGHQREINQFLLGFGIEAQKALEFFDVQVGKTDPTGKTFTLRFEARDPDDTMQFLEATLVFDRESLRPKTIVLIDTMHDRTEIELGDVRYNTRIREALFEPKWPRNTEILEH